MTRDYSRLFLGALFVLLIGGLLWAFWPAKLPKGAPAATAPAPVVMPVPLPSAAAPNTFVPMTPKEAMDAAGQGHFAPVAAQVAPAPLPAPAPVVMPVPPRKAKPSRRLVEPAPRLPPMGDQALLVAPPRHVVAETVIRDVEHALAPKALKVVLKAGGQIRYLQGTLPAGFHVDDAGLIQSDTPLEKNPVVGTPALATAKAPAPLMVQGPNGKLYAAE